MKLAILFICAISIAGSPHKADKKHDHVNHESLITGKSETGVKGNVSRLTLRTLAEEKMDSNHDGYVDGVELKSYISRTLRKLDEEDNLEEFLDADSNGDGFVTWDEYKTYADAEKDADDEEPAAEHLPRDEDKSLFQVADQDEDGKLDRAEFFDLKNPENAPRMYELLVDNMLKERDTNKDGFIDQGEFVPKKDAADNSEWHATEISRFNDEFDKNKDGRLDRQEILAWLAPDPDQLAQTETDHLLAEADKDKDGRLSYDEIESEYDLFASSEATNFGDDLEYRHEEL